MTPPRYLTVRQLTEFLEDLEFEMQDYRDELAIHEQYRPGARGIDAYMGTVQQWLDEWEDIKANINKLERYKIALQRESARRAALRQTNNAVSFSPVNVVFLEDMFWKKEQQTVTEVRGRK